VKKIIVSKTQTKKNLRFSSLSSRERRRREEEEEREEEAFPPTSPPPPPSHPLSPFPLSLSTDSNETPSPTTGFTNHKSWIAQVAAATVLFSWSRMKVVRRGGGAGKRQERARESRK
jgi:hypothetical protein